MLLLLRKLKHDEFMKKKTRKYLLYAVGEIILIIIGILIALQIDNWNTDRQERKALQSHLQGIATNVRSDLEQAERVLAERIERHEAAVKAGTLLHSRESLAVGDIFIAGYAIRRAAQPLRFEPTTSNYDSLKVSGVLRLLQGHDVETLLFDYYDAAASIESKEREYRQTMRALQREFTAKWPAEIKPFEFYDPSALWAERFEENEPTFRAMIYKQSTSAIYQEVINQYLLMLDYTNLIQRGQLLLELIETSSTDFNAQQALIVDNLYDSQGGVGYPALIADGQVAWHSYWMGVADSHIFIDRTIRSFDYTSFDSTSDGIHIAYVGGAEWAALWLAAIGLTERRNSLDFSGFDRLRLELKGDRDGDTVLVHLKDKDDPDDGSQTDIELQLTTDWKTFDLDLASFENADPASLHIALGFVFVGADPQTFWIRNAHYVTSTAAD